MTIGTRTNWVPRGTALTCTRLLQWSALHVPTNIIDADFAGHRDDPNASIAIGDPGTAAHSSEARHATALGRQRSARRAARLGGGSALDAACGTSPNARRASRGGVRIKPTQPRRTHLTDLATSGLIARRATPIGRSINLDNQMILGRYRCGFARYSWWPFGVALNHWGPATMCLQEDGVRQRHTTTATASVALGIETPVLSIARRLARECPDARRRVGGAPAVMSAARHVEATLDRAGATGREAADRSRGCGPAPRPRIETAFDIPGFVPEHVRPLIGRARTRGRLVLSEFTNNTAPDELFADGRCHVTVAGGL